MKIIIELLYRFILLCGGIDWVIDPRLLFAIDWSFVNNAVVAAQLLLLLTLDPISQFGSKDNGIEDERCRILPARCLQPFISTYIAIAIDWSSI